MYNWQWRRFDELTSKELYSILLLRQSVFIVEQQSIYHDIDNVDQSSLHLLVCDNTGQLVAYARINSSNLPLGEVAIGRIIVAKAHRACGLGSRLLANCLSKCAGEYKHVTIKLSAQTHLVKFYEKFGFVQMGDCYDEGGIEHIDMRINN